MSAQAPLPPPKMNLLTKAFIPDNVCAAGFALPQHGPCPECGATADDMCRRYWDTKWGDGRDEA